MEYFLLWFFPILFLYVLADEPVAVEEFFVKPGAGTLSVQTEVKNYQCKFTYSAMGGTHEQWVLKLEILDGGSAVMCSVDRDKASYLMFQDFKMELTGPMVSITEVDVKGSKTDNKDLGKEEYLLEKNLISSVSGKFKNLLGKVAVYSPLSRDDL